MKDYKDQILQKHLDAVDKSEVSYAEKKVQADREAKEKFVLDVGSILHKYGIKYSHVGHLASDATLKRLKH